jgi:hypothetical protein
MHIITPALTYDGRIFDTVLNTVVLLVLIAAFAVQQKSPSWITLVAMSALQVTLWFALGATGFSVVWCGLAGAVLVDLVATHTSRRRSPESISRLNLWWIPLAAFIVVIAAIAFYAVAIPPISTVAHLLALAVGAGIDSLTASLPRWNRSRHIRAVRAGMKTSAAFRLPDPLHKRMLAKWPDYSEGDQRLQYGIWGDAGLRISRDADGYFVERRSDRSNTYDEFRFRTVSPRELERRLLQE